MILRVNLLTATTLMLLAFAFAQPRGLAAQELDITEVSAEEAALLKEVFPDGEIFSVKQGRLPHNRAYTTNADGDLQVSGFVFMTNEIEPDEWAYESRLEMLVGMTTNGVITGLKLIDHYEPFGYFSIELPEFAEQFKGKSILDKFEEGYDIDTVARATISIESAGRVVRKSSRKIARQFLDEMNRSQ